jgi:Ca2+-binding RTX toxin-like protein
MFDLFANRFAAAGGLHVPNVVTGTEDADTLNGTSGADTISGLGGDDLINASTGFDSIDGGDGVDVIIVSDAGDTVHGGAGADFIDITIAHPPAGAGGVYAGDGDNDQISLWGAEAGDFDGCTLEGGDGDDLLQERSRGDDVLDGGAGIDTLNYRGAPRAITVDLAAGTSSGKTIGDNTLIGIEKVIGGRAGDMMSGDSLGNALVGKNGADVLEGQGGGDSLFGGGREDTLTGGLGRDSLNGGGGHDTFVYESLADSTNAAPDQIVGLKKHDVIDLSAIDADSNTAGDQAFVRVAAFDGHAGQLTLTFSAGTTLLQVDVDGDAVADMTIQITGQAAGHTDFVL